MMPFDLGRYIQIHTWVKPDEIEEIAPSLSDGMYSVKVRRAWAGATGWHMVAATELGPFIFQNWGTKS